jgi:hypothetical protein
MKKDKETKGFGCEIETMKTGVQNAPEDRMKMGK